MVGQQTKAVSRWEGDPSQHLGFRLFSRRPKQVTARYVRTKCSILI